MRDKWFVPLLNHLTRMTLLKDQTPPKASLSTDLVPIATSTWATWDQTQGIPPACWRDGPSPWLWSAQTALNDTAVKLAANRVYATVQDLVAALQA